MTLSRESLAVREGAMATAWHEGVPAAVEPRLRGWIWDTASLDEDEAEHTLIRPDLELPDSYWEQYQRELEECETQQAELDARWEATQ